MERETTSVNRALLARFYLFLNCIFSSPYFKMNFVVRFINKYDHSTFISSTLPRGWRSLARTHRNTAQIPD